jgi:hypothetical protein
VNARAAMMNGIAGAAVMIDAGLREMIDRVTHPRGHDFRSTYTGEDYANSVVLAPYHHGPKPNPKASAKFGAGA